jgi:hypothetical protein
MKKLGAFFRPFVTGLFEIVPFVLDRLWRRIDFRLNRIGHVDLENDHKLTVRPAWRHGVALLWVVLSAFAVFGPTTDAWCSLYGVESAAAARLWVGRAFVFASFIAGILVLNMVSAYMARQVAKKLRTVPTSPDQAEPAPHGSAAPQDMSPAAKFVQDTGVSAFQNLAQNWLRLVSWIPQLPRGEKLPTTIAFVVLLFGAFLVAMPLLSLGQTILNTPHDPLSCAKSPHPQYIVAQVVAFAILALVGLAIWSFRSTAHAFAKLVMLMLLYAAVIAGLWLWFKPDAPSEAVGGFYPHDYLIFVAALLIVACFSKLFAKWIFWKLDTKYPLLATLRSTDLLEFVDAQLELTWRRVLSALTHGISGHWLHFLLLPAFVTLFAPSEDLVEYVVTGAVVSAFLLTYGSLSTRWEQMILYFRRLFLVGTPLVMSIAVIVVAALRFFKVQYVATVLDAAPIGVLTIFILMMYVAFWLFEFFVNRWLGEELLALFGNRAAALQGYIDCPADEVRKSWAKTTNRYLSLHGTGQLLVQGWFERDNPGFGEQKHEAAFTTYAFTDLFDKLGVCHDLAKSRNNTKPDDPAAPGQQPAQSEEPVDDGLATSRTVMRSVRLYFTVVNLLLIVTAGMLFAWHRNWSVPLAMKPTVEAVAFKPEETSGQMPGVNHDVLAERLLAQSRESRDSIIVAASGGGTRAAVYTAVALEGVGKLERTRDIVLLSGVSGGGMSAAVFASRFDDLKAAKPPADAADASNAWSKYIAVTAEPYIQDVLEGAGELRVSADSALGVLLAESLGRRAFAASMTSVRTLGDLHGIGLILNSSITGHPYKDSELLRGRVAAPKDSCVGLASPYANLAGGRLILTNLTNVHGFPQPTELAPDMWLPYTVVNDGSVELAAASSLTANFPPVFPNARVRIVDSSLRKRPECAVEDQAKRPLSCDCDRLSYFVTDGGATENLGLVSALFALSGTLDKLDEVAPGGGAAAAQAKSSVHLTDVHILALEASAVDYDYSGTDRGIGAATGGSKERINAGLTQVLLDRVKKQLEDHGAKLHVHYLPLPVAFRSRGGFGTHWMFAREIQISNPLLPVAAKEHTFSSGKSDDQVKLQRAEVLVLWRALYDPGRTVCEQASQAKEGTLPKGWTSNVATVARWICGHDDRRDKAVAGREPLPDFQVSSWACAIEQLRPPAGTGAPPVAVAAASTKCHLPGGVPETASLTNNRR